VTELRFSSADLPRCRFAVSPLWETHSAVRVMFTEHRRPLYEPWITKRRAATASADFQLLRAAQPHVGYAPDFLTPPPRSATTTLAAELERVRRTPLEQVTDELTRCRDQPTNPLADVLDPMVRDPAAAREQFCEALRTAWSVLLKPDWPKVRRILDDDVAYRGTCLTDNGLDGLFDDLHPNLAWTGRSLVASYATDASRDLAGQGLLLIPSAFNWPHLSVITDQPYQPTLVYPARGTARLWTDTPPPPDRLARLLGRTRATLLAALDEPTTTSALSDQFDLGLGTVSEHLSALQGAGLTNKRRAGHQVRYRRTSLGQALIDGAID
jgi:DNA-binding transcriptional ArsR family regulator